MWGDISLWVWFAFPCDFWGWASCHVLVGHLSVFTGKMSVQILCLFLNQTGFCFFAIIWVLYVFWIFTIWFANAFSHYVGCHFILLMGFFCCLETWIWCSSHLIIFALVAFAFSVKSKNLSRQGRVYFLCFLLGIL